MRHQKVKSKLNVKCDKSKGNAINRLSIFLRKKKMLVFEENDDNIYLFHKYCKIRVNITGM